MGYKQSLFEDFSCTLLRAESLVSIVAVGQDAVLGSCELSREHDELMEKCEFLK